ncbi:hypothetical protein ScPMuIL_014145 [Solemya velum]
MGDFPYRGEYAKSSRSSCKGCRGTISQDSLRLAVMVQSPVFDGKIPNWFHYACFWNRNRLDDPNSIHGYDALRWEDQQKIKEHIGGGGGGDSGGNAIPGSGVNDFTTEYAKSGRSTCRGCEDKISKGSSVRLQAKLGNRKKSG